jgi:hypothetical protein
MNDRLQRLEGRFWTNYSLGLVLDLLILRGGYPLKQDWPASFATMPPVTGGRDTRGQMHPDTPAGFTNAGADLEQFYSDGVNLGGFQLGATQVTSQQPEKSISGSK